MKSKLVRVTISILLPIALVVGCWGISGSQTDYRVVETDDGFKVQEKTNLFGWKTVAFERVYLHQPQETRLAVYDARSSAEIMCASLKSEARPQLVRWEYLCFCIPMLGASVVIFAFLASMSGDGSYDL